MEETVFSHYPVMKEEAISALNVRPDGVYVDCTCGGGGHSYEIASKLTRGGRLVCIDRDDDALAACGKRLERFGDRVTTVKSNFEAAAQVLSELGIRKIDGALIDLGVSSYQLDTPERGFSYMNDAPLDMRMDRSQNFTARDLVNNYPEEEIKRILYTYGEEKYAARIAAAIVQARAKRSVGTTGELVAIIKGALPAKALNGGHHPAKKTFQALRIEVNGELSVIEPTLRSLTELLGPGGRLAVITFHSLEDRIVKTTFASLASGCTCPKEFPVCVCNKKPRIRVIDKGTPPSDKEIEENPRSRSARLRSAEKL